MNYEYISSPRKTASQKRENIAENQKLYGTEIRQLTEISISSDSYSRKFAQSLVENMSVKGIKATEKMILAMNNIIAQNNLSREDIESRKLMVRKLEVLKDMVLKLDHKVLSNGYIAQYSALPFVESLLDQAKTRGGLSEKQFVAVNKVYLKYKKKYDKSKNKA